MSASIIDENDVLNLYFELTIDHELTMD
jgi:hypothetical protein